MKKICLSVMLCCILVFQVFFSVGCQSINNQGSEEYYTITYNLNDGSNKAREIQVPNGANGVYWNASREGYKLNGWYTTPFNEGEFNFDQPITKNYTIYASWTKKKEYDVTFDFGFLGAKNKTIDIDGGELIERAKVPSKDRLGMTFTGWYKDESKTQLWDFDNDIVQNNTTLYAGYENTPSYVKRDENGNIVYNNTVVNILVGTPFAGIQDVFKVFVENFNKEYKGKIEVRIGGLEAGGQDTYSLRIQQNPGKNTTESTYYSIADVYDMAGIEYSLDDYYEKGSQDAYIDDLMTSIPLGASVPYIVYNKSLMTKYNGTNPLPSNYSELLALLKKVYKGESQSKSSFISLQTINGWYFNEMFSTIGFLQNGACLWGHNGTNYYTNWSDSKVVSKAEIALKNMYNLFGVSGSAHGAINNVYDIVTAVKNKDMFMSIVPCSGDDSSIFTDNSLGVMCLSGLFTDNTNEDSQYIPVHSFGMAFYKNAGYVTSTQLAAAAVFADYVSKHSEILAKYGFVAMRKEASEKVLSLYNGEATFLYNQVVKDMNNIFTFDGCISGKTIINNMFSENIILPTLQKSVNDFSSTVSDFANILKGMFA